MRTTVLLLLLLLSPRSLFRHLGLEPAPRSPPCGAPSCAPLLHGAPRGVVRLEGDVAHH